MIRSALLFLLVAGFCCIDVRAQKIPPTKFDGFLYPPGRVVDPDTILVEAFFDPICPDSRDAWLPLTQILDHYGSRVAVVVHLLPLPYHDNAFVASRALHIVNAIDTKLPFILLEGFFKNQAMFYNSQTQLMSRPAVVEEIVKLGGDTLGTSYESDLKSGFSNSKSDLATRVSFKYSTSRGVSATPTFFVNGFVLPNAGSPLDYEEWRNIIDPLVEDHEGAVQDL